MPFRFYAHLSWTTWARLPLIDEQVAHFLGPFLLAEAKRHGARVVEIGIVSDHVHLLLELPPVYDTPRLVQGLKGASARSRIATATHPAAGCAGTRAMTFGRWGFGSWRVSPRMFATRN